MLSKRWRKYERDAYLACLEFDNHIEGNCLLTKNSGGENVLPMVYHDVKDFDKDVLQLSDSIPVVVDFWAEWCGPCMILTPVLERLAEKHKGVWELKKLNTEQFPDIAAQYEIRSIPNVKMFFGGKGHH